MGKYDGLAALILREVGGLENVESVTHCMTRLRFKLRNSGCAKTEELKQTDGIVTALLSGGQYMVVIGNQVDEVYNALLDQGCVGTAERGKALPGIREVNPFHLFVDIVTGVFAPLLGILSGMGMLMGLLYLLNYMGVLPENNSTYNILYALSDTIFYFFPVILGYSAAKKFGLPPVEGLVLGAALVHPYLIAGSGYDVGTLFGVLPVFMPSSGDYSRSLIPIICAVALAAWLEKRLRDKIPEAVRSFMLPLVVITVSYLATMLVIGPVSEMVADLLGLFFTFLSDQSPVLLGMFVGGLWQILVMFGLHWVLVPMAISNITTMGFDTILVASFCTTFAQTGAVLAIYLKTKDPRTKRLCPPAIISGIAGITEPCIYGITLPRRAPYLISCLVSSAAGMLAIGLGGRCYQTAGMGVFGYMAFIQHGCISGMWLMLWLSLASMAVCFVLVYTTCAEDAPQREEPPAEEPKKAPAAELPAETPFVVPKVPDRDPDSFDDIVLNLPPEGESLPTPLAGAVISLCRLPDPIFSEELMGKGFAVRPTGRVVYAPVAAWIRTVAKTGHAVGMVTDSGVEILVHVGIDTVKMEGDGFEPLVHMGQRVHQGQPLLRFDPVKIVEAGYTLMSPVVITNSFNLSRVELVLPEGTVTEPGGEPVLRIEG